MDSYSILNIVMAKVWGGGEQYVYDTSKALISKENKVYIAADSRNKLLTTKYKKITTVIKCNLYSMAGLVRLEIVAKHKTKSYSIYSMS